jgi:hypothetical protein
MTVETTFGLRNTMDSQLSDDGPLGSCGHLVGSVPTNALVLTGLANFRAVGNPEVIQDLVLQTDQVPKSRLTCFRVRKLLLERLQRPPKSLFQIDFWFPA